MPSHQPTRPKFDKFLSILESSFEKRADSFNKSLVENCESEVNEREIERYAYFAIKFAFLTAE